MSSIRQTAITFLLLITLLGGCATEDSRHPDPQMDGDFWKTQAIDDIIIPWTQNGLNTETNTFPTYMDREWKPFRSTSQNPGMVSRHIFSYSTAYLLTGEDKYLDLATQIVEYMIEYGWDSEYGLWYNEIDEEGNPVDFDKGMFMQLYAVTGLAMYYVITHDETVLEYIQESIELLNTHAHDEQYGGYINALNRNLTVKDPSKRATPQLAPLSGYLAYLYPVTKNDQYLNEMTDGVDLILDKMISPEEQWLMGSFDEQWQVNIEQSDKINVGHNLEIVWTLLRLHLLTGNESYKEKALEIYPQLYEVTFNEETGAWHHNFSMANNAEKADSTPWWVQAYGNMLELYLYRITEDQIHLDRFQQGADFWNNYFIDKEYGAAYLSVRIDGEIENGNKAVRSKTSYHSMEHGLLNYLYLNLWVQNKPVTLNFKIKSSEEGERLYPNLVEDPEVKISSVTVNGSEWNQFNPEEGYITLPELRNGSVQVQLSR